MLKPVQKRKTAKVVIAAIFGLFLLLNLQDEESVTRHLAGSQEEVDHENPAGECQSWCIPHPDPWDMKCTFKHCNGCSKCFLDHETKPAGTTGDDTADEKDKTSEVVPVYDPSDKIAKHAYNNVVIPDYKLFFFTFPKVGCTEWKELARRGLGLGPSQGPYGSIHGDPAVKHITSFPSDQIQEILTSDEWTRAAIVREPKERVLSAFLDKFAHTHEYTRFCCRGSEEEVEFCKQKQEEKDFHYFLHRTKDCYNEHWAPQRSFMDEKWWAMMNFIGHMDTVTEDANTLLSSVKHQVNGTSLWEDVGSTGWGPEGKTGFMVKDEAKHATSAHDHLREYYTPCMELFVEKHWATDYESEYFHFEPFRLFDESEYPSYEECDLQRRNLFDIFN